MLVTLGDLVDDIVVRVDDPLNVASDTAAHIERRRGGSAANVAGFAARSGHRARFVGQVGDDPLGHALVADLASAGVETGFVRTGGRTGSIVVLVDASGERTMLSDRGACSRLDRPEPAWLDGAATLHVPLYSLVGEPMASTAATAIGWARQRGVDVSIDLSSVALVGEVGVEGVRDLLGALRPDVVLANLDEADALGVGADVFEEWVTIVKRGGEPAHAFTATGRHEVATVPVDTWSDTTGAGDAFAAGFLTSDWRADVVGACRAGHHTAARLLSGPRDAPSVP